MEFRTLVIHFFGRFFDRESRIEDSDSYTGFVQLLTLMILPGALLSIFYMVTDPYVYICYSMVVTGIVMTLKWDSLFPDRRDYLVLSPLPLSTRRIFAAKLLALMGFLLLFAVAINLFSMIVVPTVYLNPSGSLWWTLHAFEAHAAGVLGASFFTALLFAAIQGILINVLAPSTFRRISPRIQMVAITVLVMTFLTMPLFRQGIGILSQEYPRQLGYLPFIWFLGLYRSLLPGDTSMPLASVWGSRAIEGTLVTAVIAALSYAAGYVKYSRKILESEDSDALNPTRWGSAVSAILNGTVLRDPFERATFYFIGRIANRSAKHRIVTALYTGSGIAWAISFAFTFDPRLPDAMPFRLSPQGSLDAPLILTLLIITGLRATFNIPYELGANWMFQISTGSSANFLSAVRKWVFLCRIIPLYAVLAWFEFHFFSPATAVAHLVFGIVASALTLELLFLRFNKVPFTCTYPQDKFRMAGLAIGYFYGFVAYVLAMGGLKRVVTGRLAPMVLFLAVSALTLCLISLYRRRSYGRPARVVYQELKTVPLSIAGDAGYWRDTPRAG